MALIFQRLAHNFAKNGYYPTDSETIEKVVSKLSIKTGAVARILDPCAGEGIALAEVKNHLTEAGAKIDSYAIEFNEERAYHAKKLTDSCIHGSVFDTVISSKSFGLLWLNPPYGDAVADSAKTGNSERERLEKQFYKRTIHLLQPNGVLVLIIPYYILDKEFCKWITTHITDICVFCADRQFKQIVIMGKRTTGSMTADEANVNAVKLFNIGSMTTDEYQAFNDDEASYTYLIPAQLPSNHFKFYHVPIDAAQLGNEIKQYPCLWDTFNSTFSKHVHAHKPPLRALSDWHLSIALAAGQIQGFVYAGNKKLLIKGDTFKEKRVTTKSEINDDEVTTTTEKVDLFCAVIKAIDFTPDSPTFGDVITIR